MTQKLSQITKAAGKSLVGVSVADVASITGATAAWGAYERQMSQLQAQAAAVNRTQSGQDKMMRGYTETVRNLRKEYGTTTGQAAQLTQTISKMVNPQQQKELKGLTSVFTEMQNATGEDSKGLASSLLNLNKIMGTSMDTKVVREYSDQITTLAASTNTSAKGLTDFATQIAPVGRLLGVTQTEIIGTAKAFASAGQDGYQAATAYSSIVSDIAQATASGNTASLAKYANIIGVTAENFNKMDGGDKLVQIIDKISEGTPLAIRQLNQLGLDGVRTQRAFAALQSQGGIGLGVSQAEAAYGSGSTKRASDSATKGITDDLAKLRQELQQTGENLASIFGPAITKVVGVLEKVSGIFEEITNGPMGKFIQVIAAVVAPVAAAGGALLLMAGALLKVAGAAMIFRNSGAQGIRAGWQDGGAQVRRNADGSYSYGGQNNRGNQMAVGMNRVNADGSTRGQTSFIQRGMFNTGAGVGGFIRTVLPNSVSERSFRSNVGAVAGAGARGTLWAQQNLIRPQFDQLRYGNPADRTTWMNQQARMPGFLSGAFRQDAAVNAAQAQARYDRARQVVAGERAASGGSASTTSRLEQQQAQRDLRAARMAEQAAQTRAAADREAAATTRTSSAATTGNVGASRAMGAAAFSLTRTLAGATAAVGRFAASLAARGVTPGMGIAGVAGMGLAINSATGVGEKTGMNNTINLGLMGAMTGGMMGGARYGMYGAVAGAAIGAGTDMAKTNNSFMDSVDSYEETTQSGGSMKDRFDAARQVNNEYDELRTKINDKGLGWSALSDPSAAMANAKNKIEDIFGKSDLKEGAEERDQALDPLTNQIEALRKLAEAQGTDVTGDENTQIEKLDGVLASLKPTMDDLGITVDQLGAAQALSTGTGSLTTMIQGTALQNKYGDDPLAALVEQLINPGEASGLNDRIRGLGGASANFIDSTRVQSALDSPGDINAQYQAITGEYAHALEQGLSPLQVLTQMGNVKAEVGTPDDPTYGLAGGVQNYAMQQLQYQMPTMNRTQQFSTQAATFQAQAQINPGDPEQMANMQAASDTFMQQAEAQRQYFVQLLTQQREFNISMNRQQEDFGTNLERSDYQFGLSRQRAQADFHQQRMWQEADYKLGRQRAEDDYQLQRDRGQRNYNQQMRRGSADFMLARKRQEEDYQHSVRLMQEQAAQQLYSIYDRVEARRTSSAAYLLVNADDQLERMRKQADDLNTLRKRGLSDDAIQQLGFNDSANAQQLSRFTAEADPATIRKFNKAVRERIEAAAALVTDESSKDWQEFQRSYNRARNQAKQDFEKQVNRSHRDFNRQMGEMEEDFRRSMSRQATDYETSQDRQQKQFSLSMKRSAADYATSVDNMTKDFNKSMSRAQKDMNRSAVEISGTLEEILTKATQKLDGNAQKQAKTVLKTFRGLSGALGPEANEIMSLMSEIFGFKFTPVKPNKTGAPGSAGNGTSGDNQMGGGNGVNMGMHEGGVLPGRSIGRDNMHFYSQEHGKLSLAGGEAVMVPEWVDAIGGPTEVRRLNANARAGRFDKVTALAEGGVVNASKNPDARVYVDGEPMSAVAAAQLKLAEQLGRRDMQVMQGSWQPYSDYSKSSHMGPGVMDTGPGDFKAQGDLRQVGFAAWGRNFSGAATAGSGAHVHSVSRLDPGARNHAQLSSFARGEDGLGHKDYGPNPPLLPNLLQLLGRFMNVAVYGGGSNFNPMASFDSITQDTYPAVEKAASNISLLGGFPKGFWSKKINQMARQKYNELSKKYTADSPGMNLGIANPPSGMGDASNQEIVHRAMTQHPFGENHWDPLKMLVNSESGFSNTAQNPRSSAFGLFQFLDGTWGPYGPKTSDPWKQSVYGMQYIADRYGDPTRAWDFKKSHNWYGEGSIFSGGAQTIGVGERGPEMVLPLDGRGVNFLGELMMKTQAGTQAKATGTNYSSPVQNHYHSYSINRSTNFTGAITVVAQDPMMMANNLKARARVQALAQASLGGSRG